MTQVDSKKEVEKYKAGLGSDNPEEVLTSAIWIAENPEKAGPDVYSEACGILHQAASNDSECVRYIDANLSGDPLFKIQLFSNVLRESNDNNAKKEARTILESLIDLAFTIKESDTETVANIYLALKESGCPDIVEKAKKLL